MALQLVAAASLQTNSEVSGDKTEEVLCSWSCCSEFTSQTNLQDFSWIHTWPQPNTPSSHLSRLRQQGRVRGRRRWATWRFPVKKHLRLQDWLWSSWNKRTSKHSSVLDKFITYISPFLMNIDKNEELVPTFQSIPCVVSKALRTEEVFWSLSASLVGIFRPSWRPCTLFCIRLQSLDQTCPSQRGFRSLCSICKHFNLTKSPKPVWTDLRVATARSEGYIFCEPFFFFFFKKEIICTCRDMLQKPAATSSLIAAAAAPTDEAEGLNPWKTAFICLWCTFNNNFPIFCCLVVVFWFCFFAVSHFSILYFK